MRIKKGLISALAISVVLGVSSLGVVNADDSSSIETTTPATIDCSQDGTGKGPQDGTGIGAQNGNRGCGQNAKGKQNGKGKNREQGTIGKNSNFKKSIEQLQEQGVLSEEDVKNVLEYHIENKQQKKYDNSCTKVDDMVAKNIITAEQGEKLKSTLETNLKSVAQ